MNLWVNQFFFFEKPKVILSIVLYMYMYVYELFTYKQYDNINTCKIRVTMVSLLNKNIFPLAYFFFCIILYVYISGAIFICWSKWPRAVFRSMTSLFSHFGKFIFYNFKRFFFQENNAKRAWQPFSLYERCIV